MSRYLSPTRVLCILAAIMLVVFAASAGRFFAPGARENTRSGAAHKTAQREAQQRSLHEAITPVMGTDGATPVERVRLMAAPYVPPRRHAVLLAPEGRSSGSDALGTSLPRSSRWKALGGHGRHGAG